MKIIKCHLVILVSVLAAACALLPERADFTPADREYVFTIADADSLRQRVSRLSPIGMEKSRPLSSPIPARMVLASHTASSSRVSVKKQKCW
ncbi:MAG: hypothetical protein IPH48_15615 [bacterium]|nr:hypothetical protein [bacterium]